MTHYLDASAILPMLVTEPKSAAVTRWLANDGDGLIVSEFAAAEVASALSRLVRMEELDLAAAGAHLADFDAWRAGFTADVTIDAADLRLANSFVRRFDLGLRAPDAVHAAICRRGDHVLVTLDRRLATAAETLGLRAFVPA